VQKVAQTFALLHYFSKKLPKISNDLIGEYSPNLVNRVGLHFFTNSSGHPERYQSNTWACCLETLSMHIPPMRVWNRVARFFLVQMYQNGKIYAKGPQTTPNGYALYQMAINYTKWPYIIPNGHTSYQMAIHYTKWP
jgi:hypothetical protein